MADTNESDDSAQPGGATPAPGLIARVKLLWVNPAYRFVMLFLPFLGVVAVAYPEFVRRHNPVIQSFILWTAKIEYWIFRVFSEAAKVDEKLVTFDGFSVTIIDECTGIYEMLIFSAAVLAFPTSWKKKALGLLLGNPTIYLFNVVRIAMLIVVGRYWPGAFDFMHLYFWQATMIVMIVSVWLLWITQVVRTDEAPAPAAT